MLPASLLSGQVGFYARYTQFLYTRDYNGGIVMLQRFLAKSGLDEIDQLNAKDALGSLLYLAGQKDAARALYAQLLVQLKHVRQSPADDVELASIVADAYMTLGNKAAALSAARRNVVVHSYCSVCKPDAVAQLAQVQARFGNRDAAISVLPHLLTVPAGLTVANLRLDPGWDPLRNDPRFRALLKKYANAAPAVATSEANP